MLTTQQSLNSIDQTLKSFVSATVAPAFEEIAAELRQYGRGVRLSVSSHQASIIAKKGDYDDLYYGIRAKAYQEFNYTFPSFDPTDMNLLAYREILLRSGIKATGKTQSFTPEGIIHDFLNEYDKWAILN